MEVEIMPKELANTVYHYTGRNWMLHDIVGDKRVHTCANIQTEKGKPFSTSKSNTRVKYTDGEMHFADRPWKTIIISLDYSEQEDVEKYMYHDDAIKGHKKWIKSLVSPL